jgi:patatin-like phospholipase/acyl hydrolase
MTKFILSIDGGGIRGVIPATILTVLTEKLKQRRKKLPLHRYFDIVAGTSTGAIIAAGLTCPKPGQPTQPAADAETLLDLYKSKGQLIFDLGMFGRLGNDGYLNERYDAAPLEEILKGMLGTTTEIKDALRPVIITAYDIEKRRAMFLSNVDRKHERFLFWQAVRGSSAAPTYFEPAQVEDIAQKTEGETPTIPLIDGGVFANDPAMAAYVEGVKQGWAGNMVILSLGTGSTNHPYPFAKARNWGSLGWIKQGNDSPIISVLMQGQSSTASYQLDRLLNPDIDAFGRGATHVTVQNRHQLNYFRIDARLGNVGDPSDALDDATPGNIAKLERFGRDLAKTHDLALEEIADRLVATAIPNGTQKP